MERPITPMPDHEFKKLGETTDAYIRREKAGALKKQFPSIAEVSDDDMLYVVSDAAGDPQFITDTEPSALGIAASQGYRVWRVN